MFGFRLLFSESGFRCKTRTIIRTAILGGFDCAFRVRTIIMDSDHCLARSKIPKFVGKIQNVSCRRISGFVDLIAHEFPDLAREFPGLAHE